MVKSSFKSEITENIFQIALIGGILFLLFSHPFLFYLTDRSFEYIGIDFGPTMQTILHAIVFTIGFFYTIKYVMKYT